MLLCDFVIIYAIKITIVKSAIDFPALSVFAMLVCLKLVFFFFSHSRKCLFTEKMLGKLREKYLVRKPKKSS